MRKNELVQSVAEQTGFKVKDVGTMASTLFEIIGDELAKGEKIQITGFGTFETRKSAERTGKNPQTGEKMMIPARTTAKFKAGKLLKEKVDK